ncbi:MAG: polyphosphate kinase 1 [Ruminococcus sp.]|nr:polyphosphate kinase 1 [Ruminococcus sp.]MCM1382311.1 polyphosphate kinase 1 [Muribaculaceae bacterium]
MKDCYDNRELSWLKFNERVLEEAADKSVPLCERLMFAAIFQSNLDEFFMIRVGSLYDRTLVDSEDRDNKTDMTCSEQLAAIFKRAAELVTARDEAYRGVMAELEKHGVEQVDFSALDGKEEDYLKVYFTTEILPLISPQVIDKRHPFPFLKNKEIYAVAHLESKSSVKLAIVPASGSFSRIIFLPGAKHRFMLVEELILHYMPLIFENYKILDKSLMRITRNADINMEEALYDHDVDLRDVMSELLKKRKKLSPVRMELSRKLGSEAVEYLCEKLELSKEQVFRLKTPLDLSFVYPLRSKLEDSLPLLFFGRADPQHSREVIKDAPMIPQIARRDILLSYPFESIKPFLRLLVEAAHDPSVVSVKITLYRVASDSKVIDALISAAENGKDVLVLVELRARFDEENNIGWSQRLERAGCNVIYGPESLKVHSKLLLITRKTSGGKIEYITQIGTGNYNEKTSALYTDLSLMTANRDIGDEAAAVFNALSTGSLVEHMGKLLVAPLCLQNKIIEMIDGEIAAAKRGEDGFIGLKLNSLTDKTLMDKLVEASQSGVKVRMVIRGICCLAAGVEGYTENIEITSIVGRYLEHSRIYIFGTPERRKIYISSADFMTRNTLRRVEVAVPIYDSHVRSRIMHIFDVLIRDNVKARKMSPDGTYSRVTAEGEPIDSQSAFIREAYENAAKAKEARPAKRVHKVKPTLVQRIKNSLKGSPRKIRK